MTSTWLITIVGIQRIADSLSALLQFFTSAWRGQTISSVINYKEIIKQRGPGERYLVVF